MSNYEYIISSLPAISLDWKFGEDSSFGSCVSWIRTQLDVWENKVVDRLLYGFNSENLNICFYQAALKDYNRFIREYYAFDLNVRNAKARFLNRAFGRPDSLDTINLEAGEFHEAALLEGILADKDLLSRERGLDLLTWNKILEINTFDYFSLEAILGYVARLHIISRWAELDEQTGREMFHRLIDEVRATCKGVEYTAPEK